MSERGETSRGRKRSKERKERDGGRKRRERRVVGVQRAESDVIIRVGRVSRSTGEVSPGGEGRGKRAQGRELREEEGPGKRERGGSRRGKVSGVR